MNRKPYIIRNAGIGTFQIGSGIKIRMILRGSLKTVRHIFRTDGPANGQCTVSVQQMVGHPAVRNGNVQVFLTGNLEYL